MSLTSTESWARIVYCGVHPALFWYPLSGVISVMSE